MKNLMIVFFLVPFFVTAQKSHTVKPKETLYSLSRTYNVHPRELAAFNNIPVETSLSVGQVIKIPAKTTMEPLSSLPPVKTETEIQKETVTKKETEIKATPIKSTTALAKKEEAQPIYHKVAKKETLYHISQLYKDVSIEDIKKWNNLTGDGLSEGASLIVGYGNKAAALPSEKETVIKKEIQEVVKQTEPEKKEIEKIVKQEPVKKEETNQVTGKNFNGGIFKTVYNKQISNKSNPEEEKGQAGIFKSTSGWEDGKYYCLTNAAPAGSIVKVTNSANQKSVYAKVLDLMPDLKQNAGMVIRVSNAAAFELGVDAENFESTINF